MASPDKNNEIYQNQLNALSEKLNQVVDNVSLFWKKFLSENNNNKISFFILDDS